MSTKRVLSVLRLTLLTTLAAPLLSPAAWGAVFLSNPVLDNGNIEVSIKLDNTPQFAEAMDFFLSFDQAHYTLALPALGPNFLPPSYSVLQYEGPQHVGFSCIDFDPCPLQSTHDDVLLTWTLTPKTGANGNADISAMVSLQGINSDGTFVDPTNQSVPQVPEPTTAALLLIGVAGLTCVALERSRD